MKYFAFILVLVPFAAAAATIHVTSTYDNTIGYNGGCTLREAIANVNAAADTTSGDCEAGTGVFDTIKFSFAMPAKIRLRLGPLQIQRDVIILNPAPGSLHIDGLGMTRVFEIAAGRASMFNLTIEHGSAEKGGGILVDSGATLALTDTVVSNNRVESASRTESDGGAIYNAGTLNLTRCALSRNTAASQGGSFGGAIYNAGGNVTLTNCRLTGNNVLSADTVPLASAGGGVHNAGGTLTLSNCTLTGNLVYIGHGSGLGGAISNIGGVLKVTGSSFMANRVSGPRAASVNPSGGAIYNELGSVVLMNSSFVRNAAIAGPASSSVGGALYNFGGMMTLTNCTLSRNLALLWGSGESYGGGIYNQGTMTLTGCMLGRNGALLNGQGESYGGAIFNLSSLDLTNCTLTDNRADACTSISDCNSGGGGIATYGALTLTNCTLSGNTTQRANARGNGGGGIAGGYTATLINTIVAGSGASGNCAFEVTSAGHNLSSDGTCFAAGGSDLLNTEPQLAPLANYGGSTETLALCTRAGVPVGCRGASPALDAGDEVVTAEPANVTADQRGLPRRIGAQVDIGAYEAP